MPQKNNNINKIKIKMGKFEERLGNIENGQERIEDKLDSFIESSEKKYAGKSIEDDLDEVQDRFAGKWVEKVVFLIIGALASGAVYLITIL